MIRFFKSYREEEKEVFPRSSCCLQRSSFWFGLVLLSGVFIPNVAFAYIGPGAGFAFLGSTFVVVLTFVMAAVTILFWPVRLLWKTFSRKGIPRKARARRVVIVGLDGLDPKLLEKMMKAGELPNFQALHVSGSYSRLKTTLPALSPVAWSTFQTGVNPGAHNIFDFLTRDKRTCLPYLSSTHTEPGSSRRFLGIPMGRTNAKIQLMRKSQPFWKILGEKGIFCNILRVPISYPPEKFEGNILSAMCTPDLRGTQGTFSLFTTRESSHSAKGDGATGGEVQRFLREGGGYRAILTGPPNPGERGQFLTVPFSLKPTEVGASLTIEGSSYALKLNEFSEWIEVTFRFGRKKISGIARFCLREIGEHITLYISPINAHPNRPPFPLAHPVLFSSWLAKRLGLFGTLGLMEDTWGRNELALDDERFLAQAYLTHQEREQMFFDTLEHTREGLCVCVFDASDRIQHMFWRYLDPEHPSPREDERFADTIPEMYRKMDDLILRVQRKLQPEDVLIVLSDHGFASFRRGINLNTWLRREGYLVLKHDGPTGEDYLQDVDWSKTRAFAIGLTGLYLNRKGREASGIVEKSEVQSLKAEIIQKLEALQDPLNGTRGVRKVYDTEKEYRGLYTGEAPDLIAGYEPGYRVSWDSVTGAIEAEIFTDNIKAWSGDHHVDPAAVPGIFLSNLKLKESAPHIRDLAPTVLDLFAVPCPSYMEGKIVL